MQSTSTKVEKQGLGPETLKLWYRDEKTHGDGGLKLWPEKMAASRKEEH